MSFKNDKTPWVEGERNTPSNGPKEFGNRHPILFTLFFVIVVVSITYLAGGKGLWF